MNLVSFQIPVQTVKEWSMRELLFRNYYIAKVQLSGDITGRYFPYLAVGMHFLNFQSKMAVIASELSRTIAGISKIFAIEAQKKKTNSMERK